MAKPKRPSKRQLDAVRSDWDSRARENPRAYINWSDVADDERAFFDSGRRDYQRYVTPFLRRMHFDPRGKGVLEIGCGIGRIALPMTDDFGQYTGVDVSPEMVRIASAQALPRAVFQVVSGGDLEGVPDASIDFVFSFGVFQHLPDRGAIFNYFAETARVLRPGGIFRFQMKGLLAVSLGQLAIEAGLSGRARFGPVRLPFVRLRRLDTWQGRSVSRRAAVRECESRGLQVEEVENAGTVMMWVGGKKPA